MARHCFCFNAIAAFALLTLSRLSAATPGEEQAALLISKLRESKPGKDRDDLLWKLSEFGPEARAAGPLMMEWIQQDPKNFRVANVLEEMGAEAVPIVRQLLRSGDADVRIRGQLIASSMEWGNGELVPDLAALACRAKTVEDRGSPLGTLGQLHENREAAARVLCYWLSSRDQWEAAWAADALTELRAPARIARPALARAISSHPSGYARMRSIYALENIDIDGTWYQPAMIQALTDTTPSYIESGYFYDPPVSERVAEILARRRDRLPAVLLGNKRLDEVAPEFYLQAVEEDELTGNTAMTLLSQKPEVLRGFVDWMMIGTENKQYGGHVEGPGAFRLGFERLRGRPLDARQLASYARSKNPVIRALAVDLLGDLPQPSAASIQALVARLKDDNIRVRYAAAVGLKNAGPQARAALPALRQAAAGDRYDCVQRMASAALASLESDCCHTRCRPRVIARIWRR